MDKWVYIERNNFTDRRRSEGRRSATTDSDVTNVIVYIYTHFIA
jgi:hypothetical protein